MQAKRFTGQRIIGIAILIAAALTVWFMLRTPALEVDMTEVTRGEMRVTADDLGETRIHNLYAVSAPVTGNLLRVAFKPGAQVKAGEVLAEIQPVAPSPVDARSYAQTTANIAALEAQVAAASAQVQEARAAEQLARSNFARADALLGKGFVSKAQHDAAKAELARSRAASAAAVQAQNAAQHSLQAARASLATTAAVPKGQVVRVIAPVSGSVLRVLQESDRAVVAGTALVEIGDPADLEIVSDMLSADAVRVKPGAEVIVDGWGGDAPLKGKVRLVEPFGFTKISALGVEEQRVNVVVDLTDPRASWGSLGHGYRVIVRVALWSAPDVLRVPVGALFRQGANWAAFVVGANGKARMVQVKVGHMSDEYGEVLGGLSAGDKVILHPGDKVKDGVKVKAAS
ncbi:efflux RND transporter periplasmic adaptor subunit [Novosphingobium sp.]|uniref:efflux RND transporter periplasmic adaptor subunit n=1 Tax=Novosphingobium sp. TaxID=1874826 RepID=UPI0035B3EC83